MPLAGLVVDLLLRVDDRAEQLDRRVEILQFHHPAEHLPHGKQYRVELLLGSPAAFRAGFCMGQGRLEAFQPAVEIDLKKLVPSTVKQQKGR